MSKIGFLRSKLNSEGQNWILKDRIEILGSKKLIEFVKIGICLLLRGTTKEV